MLYNNIIQAASSKLNINDLGFSKNNRPHTRAADVP